MNETIEFCNKTIIIRILSGWNLYSYLFTSTQIQFRFYYAHPPSRSEICAHCHNLNFRICAHGLHFMPRICWTFRPNKTSTITVFTNIKNFFCTKVFSNSKLPVLSKFFLNGLTFLKERTRICHVHNNKVVCMPSMLQNLFFLI